MHFEGFDLEGELGRGGVGVVHRAWLACEQREPLLALRERYASAGR